MEPLTGDDPDQVAGYRLRARLGAGGMGRVYLAFTAGGRPVALKMIRPELGGEADFRGRFRQEVEAARRVHGLYTAQVLDADPDASPPWLVTAYVPGPSLQEAVAAHGPLPAGTALLLMAGVAEALQAIHAAGLVHRDLKPSNVLLAADGPRVIDFGIARAAEATTVTRTGMAVGSPPFMAPEQVEGRPVSPATDVFALGSVVGYAALGRLPFGTGNDHAMLYRIVNQAPDLDGCPPEVRPLIERCLAKEPAARPSPEEIIRECGARTAGHTLQIARSWLPPAVAAGLAPAVAAGLAPAVAAGLAPTVPPDEPAVPPFQPTVTATAGPAGPRPGLPSGSSSGSSSGPGPGGPGLAGRIRRRPLAAALGAVVVAGAATGIALTATSGGNPGSRPPSGASSQAAGASPAAATGPAASPAVSPSATAGSPSAAADPARCVAGTWRAVTQQFTASINGQQVVFTGSGAVSTFSPDGQLKTDYNKTVFSADVNGVEWTQTFQGTSTGHWAVQNDDILFSSVLSTGTVVLRDDGAYNNSGPIEAEPGTVPYQCTGSMMREYFPNGGSDQLARVAAAG